MLRTAKTVNGGYKSSQVKLMQQHFGTKWKKSVLANKYIDKELWDQFYQLGQETKPTKNNKDVINPISMSNGDWSWRPDDADIPEIKKKKKTLKLKKKKKSRKKKNYSKIQDKSFYASREWRELRYRVIRKYKAKCMACGKSPQEHGAVLHVDHIKPKSKFPELALEFNNLQLLCEDCNMGKSNKFIDDWRTDEEKDSIDKLLDEELLKNIPENF